MKKYFLLYFIFIGLSMSSCNEKEQPIPGPLIGKLHFYIEYSSIEGSNLLRNDSQIEIFYDRNGISEKVKRPNLDRPYGFSITTQRDIFRDGTDDLVVKVFPSDYLDDEDISTTYIKFADNPMDTVHCQFNRMGESIYLINVWHNGKLVWDKQTGLVSPLIHIIE